MLHSKKYKSGRSVLVSLCALLAVLMAAISYASNTLVQDRRISMAQAQALAENSKDTAFPIVVNDLVLAQLNKYIGTPEGRDFMRSSLQRMESYRHAVEGKLREYNMPMEIMAVPLIESGYQNLAGDKNQATHAAGLWQFIAPTARHFNLIVDAKQDQRLNAALETDAALRYLLMNKLRFNDWQLSAMAYNMGENSVEAAIAKNNSRDAWVLIRYGSEIDKNYLAKLMAAILIMKNPSTLN